MDYWRERASSVLDLPWAIADGARRAARPVRRAGEELWSSVLDLPWLVRDAWKRVALVAFAAVLVVVPGVRYFAGETASGGVAGASIADPQGARQQVPPTATAFEPRVGKPRPHIRAQLGRARAARTRARTERLALIEQLATTARRATAAAARRAARPS